MINENDTTTTDEISFGDNDFLAAQVAVLVDAVPAVAADLDAGVADRRPAGRSVRSPGLPRSPIRPSWRRCRSARRRRRWALAGCARRSPRRRWRRPRASRPSSAPGSSRALLGRAWAGEPVGTRFAPHPVRQPSFKLWLRYAKPSLGRVRSTRARRGRCGTAARRCCRSASWAWTARSRRVTRSTCASTATARVGKGISNYSAVGVAAGDGAAVLGGARSAAPRDRGSGPPGLLRPRLAVVPKDVVHPGLPGGWWLPRRSQHQGGHRMRLHANARLSPTARRLLVDRVLSGRWTISAAAAGGGVSERTARKWLARWRAEGEPGCWIAPRRRRHVANRTDEQTVAGDRRVAPVAVHRSGDRRAARTGRSRRSRRSCKRIGMGKLGRLGLEPAERYERDRPGELIHIDVKKLGRIQRRRRANASRGRARTTPRPGTDARRRAPQQRRLGLRARRDRRLRPAWPTPKCSPTRRPPPRSRSCAARSRSSPATASPSSG